MEHEYDRIKRISDKKKPKFDLKDTKNLYKQMKGQLNSGSGGGGSMVFVDLFPKMSNGKDWTKSSVDDLCSRWAALIQSASLSGTVYNIDKHNVLINVEKSWMVNDILKFISKQPESESFSINSKKYTPKEFLTEFGEDDEDL